jgi:hypothetical protein
MARYICRNPERRALVEASSLNGIDFLEVVDGKVAGHPEWEPLRQLLLVVRLLKPVPAALALKHVGIDGGVRITPVRPVWALPYADLPALEKAFIDHQLAPTAAEGGHLFVVRTDSAGDFSPYRLRLADPHPPNDPPASPRSSSASRWSAPATSTASRTRGARPWRRTSPRSTISPRTTRASGG